MLKNWKNILTFWKMRGILSLSIFSIGDRPMKKHERLLAEKFLLQRIFDEDPDFVDKTMEAFSLSRSSVYNYINRLQDAGELDRVCKFQKNA